MSLIVEDGTARADAESYASVAFADAYHLSRGTADADWADLDVDVKEAALRRATDYMVATYRGRWKGTMNISTQALDWPRYNVLKDPSFLMYVPHTIVPVEVKNACAELARRANVAALLTDVVPQAVVTSERVGPVAVTYANSGQRQVHYAAVDGILRALLIDAGSEVMFTAQLG